MCPRGPCAAANRLRPGTQPTLQEEKGGAGVYSMDERALWEAVTPAERRDILPEIWGGHNIADFVDPDIEARLEALERDEDAAAAAWETAQEVRAGFCQVQVHRRVACWEQPPGQCHCSHVTASLLGCVDGSHSVGQAVSCSDIILQLLC
jgi:NOGCT (NUC087) domain